MNTEEFLLQELKKAWELVCTYKADSQRLQFLIDNRATVKYSQRKGECAPCAEVYGDTFCRRKTLREALDVMISNSECL